MESSLPLCSQCKKGLLRYYRVRKGTFCSNPHCDYALSRQDLYDGRDRTDLAEVPEETLIALRRERLLPPE
ncbi:MAG: hypothetical protein OXU86_06925 [Thaumarchaeota archaeon]|nr:hypothetical protein [Nitrososphaerota archaeon]RNJ72120.1 MAG: hypothetical protein EB832_04465 [Thaumarchaeota archaeon S14]RNJ73318.1 MAG: hypothetical protein EB833_03075 [Thaumarchaeota archaeon S13]RNJ74553.1 MAG: hypothetical protein EB824_03235 [Thaumarchaeota archaeon S15]MDD9826482.1 hypothetical protein [Nitrososphaerota archaeon]